MLQLLAAIPTIISAVSKVSDLFRKGKETVKEVTGKPSEASSPEELQTEVQQLSEAQQNKWAEVMAKEVDKYVAQNERLATEIGLVDTNLTGKVSEDAANEITLMRMTTRPWAVRWMVRYVLFPFFLVVVDMVQHLLVSWLPFLKSWIGIEPFNTFEHFFGVMKIPENADASVWENFTSMFAGQAGPTTFAGQLYMESIPWVVSIILGYMGLREVGKWRDKADKLPDNLTGTKKPSTISVVGKAITEGAGLVSKIKSWFK